MHHATTTAISKNMYNADADKQIRFILFTILFFQLSLLLRMMNMKCFIVKCAVCSNRYSFLQKTQETDMDNQKQMDDTNLRKLCKQKEGKNNASSEKY